MRLVVWIFLLLIPMVSAAQQLQLFSRSTAVIQVEKTAVEQHWLMAKKKPGLWCAGRSASAFCD